MNRCRLLLPGVLLGTLLAAQWLPVTNARAAEVDALIAPCEACHGNNGNPLNHDTPIIAGQPFTVTDDALLLFAEGKRPCTVMCAIAATLNPQQRESVAEYLEGQVFIPAEQPYDPALATHGAELHRDIGCETCHSDGGRNGNGMAPILAGQLTPYLRTALQQIKAGDRHGPKVMNQAVRALSDAEIEALLNFYAGNSE